MADARVRKIWSNIGNVTLVHHHHLAKTPDLPARHLLVDVLLPGPSPPDFAIASHREALGSCLHGKALVMTS